jgi:hypothetical protein
MRINKEVARPPRGRNQESCEYSKNMGKAGLGYMKTMEN